MRVRVAESEVVSFLEEVTLLAARHALLRSPNWATRLRSMEALGVMHAAIGMRIEVMKAMQLKMNNVWGWLVRGGGGGGIRCATVCVGV